MYIIYLQIKILFLLKNIHYNQLILEGPIRAMPQLTEPNQLM